MNKFAISMLLLTSTAAIAAPADSQCRVGAVASLKGQVELQRKQQTLPVTEGMKICRGDLFRTAASSVVELKLRDGTKMTVGKESELVVRDYRIFRSRPNLALFDLLKGAFRGISGTITSRPHRFEVKTQLATIGVRGTDFWGGFGVSPEGALDVVMLEGHGVYVKSETGQVELDKPGLGTTVLPPGAAKGLGDDMKAKNWSEDKLKRAVATITVE